MTTTEVPFNPIEQLMACLEVLGAYVDEPETLAEDELETAAWQTIELVSQLMNEHQTLVTHVQRFAQARQQAQAQQAQAATGLVVANAGQARQYIRDAGL